MGRATATRRSATTRAAAEAAGWEYVAASAASSGHHAWSQAPWTRAFTTRCRDAGTGEKPLVLLQHFRGNLDNWDPALIDDLAIGRRVVTFDNRGVGGTTDTTPTTVEAMAHDAVAFVEAMDFQRIDLLGFSIGSFVAQEIALIRPDLLRRVVLASSAPQGAAGMHGWAPEVIRAVGQPETNP